MTTERSKELTPCCGGPSPAEAEACCTQDASAKASGEQGCECHDIGNKNKETNTACC